MPYTGWALIQLKVIYKSLTIVEAKYEKIMSLLSFFFLLFSFISSDDVLLYKTENSRLSASEKSIVLFHALLG